MYFLLQYCLEQLQPLPHMGMRCREGAVTFIELQNILKNLTVPSPFSIEGKSSLVLEPGE